MGGGDGGEQGSEGDPSRTDGHLACGGRATIRLLDKAFVPEKSLIRRLIESVLVPLGEAVLHKPPIGLPRGADLSMPRSQHGRRAHLHGTGTSEIGGVTAPAIRPRAQRRTNPGGIEMEVPHQFQKIGFVLAQDGLVPPRKDMAVLVVATIVVLTIGKLERLHRARQGPLACFQ